MERAERTAVSRVIPTLGAAVVVLFTGCASGVLADPMEGSLAAELADCSLWELEGFNSCDGHRDFSLTLRDVRDADGDGRWEPGERLQIDLSFYSAAEHMNYPGLAAYPLDAQTTEAETFVWTWYGVFADQTLETTVVFEAAVDADPASLRRVAVGVGAACESWDTGVAPSSICPHPSVLIVDVNE